MRNEYPLKYFKYYERAEAKSSSGIIRCGVFDGTEIHEAVLTLLAIEEEGILALLAPNVEQMHVVDHTTGEVEEGAKRSVFSESARIARGAEKLTELAEYDPMEFDAIVFPGGFGGAKIFLILQSGERIKSRRISDHSSA